MPKLKAFSPEKEKRMLEAQEAKLRNMTAIEVLLRSGGVTPGEAASWFSAIDHTRTLVAQQQLFHVLTGLLGEKGLALLATLRHMDEG